MGAYATARRAVVTVADWCGRDGYEVHRAVLDVEEAVVTWASRRAPDGRTVSPGERPCVEYRPETAPTLDLGSVVLGEVLERRLAREVEHGR